MKLKILLIVVLLFTTCLIGNANPNTFAEGSGTASAMKKPRIRQGTIKGQLFDSATLVPIAGATVTVLNTSRHTLTDTEGKFQLGKLDVGNYTIQFSYSKILPYTKTDIIVKSKKITFVSVQMDMIPLNEESVTVTSGYFSQNKEQPTNTINFSSEEIRRAPGAAGDISRIIYALPSVAKVDDMINSLAVRGGNPMENTFYIDNIEIPNINHFPAKGSSGGYIGMLNVDFIQDVNFHYGGFSPQYGDKLSSVMDITYREGNKEEMECQLNLNLTGFGFQAEGPVAKGKGTYMFSLQRSFMDLLVDAIDTGAAPRYSDFQGKFTYQFSPRNKITLLGVAGIDRFDMDRETAVDDGSDSFGRFDSDEFVVGLNWFSMWSDKGYSNTSFSYLRTNYKNHFYKTVGSATQFSDKSTDYGFTLRNVNHYTLNHNHQLDFGFEFKHAVADYDSFLASYIDLVGNRKADLYIDKKITARKYALFVDYHVTPVPKLTLNVGVRGDYFSVNKNLNLAPRFSFSYKVSSRTKLTGAAGIFYQNSPMILYTTNEAHKELKDPMNYHVTAGIKHLITDSTQLTLEAYMKEYRHLPQDLSQPGLCVLDDQYGMGLSTHTDLVDTGKAYSRGIELTIQKKLKKKFYGMATASYSQTRYKDLNGIWRNRAFDNRFQFNIEGGYKPNKKWDFSLRWIYAGGKPYTPFDIEASTAVNSGILDTQQINAMRAPAYHSLNVRCDKRYYFRGSNLTVFLSIWNAYNRKNFAEYYWNEIKNARDRYNQWSLFPVIGLEFEF
ncbi:MAG: TonB-dependent receptor [bacterium]|nr:TonB-dependent receptor [bacterium]